MMPPFELSLMNHPPAKYVRSDRYKVPAKTRWVKKFWGEFLRGVLSAAGHRQGQVSGKILSVQD